MEYTCEVCGKQFQAAAASHRRFCSRSCYGKHSDTRSERRCKQCGASFVTNQARSSKYCSLKCSVQSKRERPFLEMAQPKEGCWYLKAHNHAARKAWRLFKGPIPKGKYILHHCDHGRCVRWTPDRKFPNGHLFLGTQKENIQDMLSKGRSWTQRPRKETKAIRAKISKANKGKKFSAAHRANLSASRLKGIAEGRIHGPVHSTAARLEIGVRIRKWRKDHPRKSRAINTNLKLSHKRWARKHRTEMLASIANARGHIKRRR